MPYCVQQNNTIYYSETFIPTISTTNNTEPVECCTHCVQNHPCNLWTFCDPSAGRSGCALNVSTAPSWTDMPAGRCQLLSSERGESGLSNSPHLVGQLEQNSMSGDALGYVTGAQSVQVACLRLA